MQRKDVIKAINDLKTTGIFFEFIETALSEIQRSEQILIEAGGARDMVDRIELINVYNGRQKHLSKVGATIVGFDATVASLRENNCGFVKLATIEVGVKMIALIFSSDGRAIGGFMVKGPKSDLAPPPPASS